MSLQLTLAYRELAISGPELTPSDLPPRLQRPPDAKRSIKQTDGNVAHLVTAVFLPERPCWWRERGGGGGGGGERERKLPSPGPTARSEI